jgi:hypothetical protein
VLSKKIFNEISEASTHCKGLSWGLFLERKEGIPHRWSVAQEKVTPDLGLAEGELSPPCHLPMLHRKDVEQIWIQEKRKVNPNTRAMGQGVRIWKITFHRRVTTGTPQEDLHPECLELQKHLEFNLRVRYHVNR